MKTTILSALSLTTLLWACAHDKAHHQGANEAAAEARSEAHAADSERRAVREQPAQSEHATGVERKQETRAALESETVPSADQAQAQHSPDNSGINERDRAKDSVTPMNQGNNEIDLDLTQRIRKAVMADDSLSFTAKNAKIITRDGRVTLRGPVKSAAEKAAVYKAAVAAAGVGHVSDQLEVDSD